MHGCAQVRCRDRGHVPPVISRTACSSDTLQVEVLNFYLDCAT